MLIKIKIAAAMLALIGLGIQTGYAQETGVKEANKAEKQLSSDSEIPKVHLNSRLLFQIIASEVALQRGQAGAAFRTYLAIADETKDPRLAERAVQIAVAANALKEFRQATATWLKLAPSNRDAQRHYLSANILSGNYAVALPIESAYLENSPERGKNILELQAQLALAKDRKQALQFFQSATVKYRDLYETQLGLARLELLNGNMNTALEYAKKAYSINANEETVSVLAGMLAGVQPEEAMKLLTNFLQKKPDSKAARNAYTQLLLKKGDYKSFDKLASQYTNDPEFVLSASASLLELRRFESAKELLEGFVKQNQNKSDQNENLSRAYLMLSDAAIQDKDFPKAVQYCSKVTGKLASAAFLQMANIYARQNDFPAALKSLSQIGTENDAISEERYLLEARIYLEMNNRAKAKAALNEGLKKLAYSKSMYYEAAMLAEQDGDLKTAEKHLKKAIEIDPDFSGAYNSLGYSLLESAPRRIKEAERYINRAYELDPTDPFILDSKGWLAFKQKKYAEAEKYLNEALDKLPELDVYLHLTELYWTTGKKSRALELLKKAEKEWPDSIETKLLKSRLKIKDAAAK